MKNFAKQLKLIAVVLLAVVMMVGMAFAVSAEETDAGNAVDLSGVTWVLEGTTTAPEGLVYSGEAYTVVPTNLPDGVTLVRTTSNTGTNAGNYTANATVKYTVDGKDKTETIKYSWSIAKTTYDMSGVAFVDGSLVYNGQAQTLEVSGTLPKGVKVTYTADTDTKEAVNAGVYTITAKFSGDTRNYETIPSLTATLTIEKAVYDMSGVTFVDTTLPYRGIAQCIEIGGTLPSGVRVFYDASYKNVGSYLITATFQGDEQNYEPIPLMRAMLTIVPAAPEDCVYIVKDSAGREILKIVAADGIPADKINLVDNTYLYGIMDVSEYYKLNVFAAYDIGFSFQGSAQRVGEKLTVTLLIPEDVRSNENIELVHITDDGKIKRIEADRVGDTFVFETKGVFSFAIVEGYSTFDGENDILPWWMILLFVLDGLSIAFLIVALCLKPRDPKGSDEDETPADETPEEEAAAEETPAEETPAEEAPAEETPAEEAHAEEAPAEEAPAEETPAEEAPAEEAHAEEAPAEETPAEEKAPEAAPVASADEDEDVGSQVIDGQVVMVRYRSSFMSRLIQAEPEIQDYYTVIKNTLLSYKGVKARTSWNYESFNQGRFQCAKLNIKGRTLSLYLALAPEEYNASKYHFSDVSGKGKFDKVPMMLKIRSDRALKYAVELIEELMKAHDIPAGPAQNVDYRMPFETNEALAARDLVKVIVPDGVTIGENDSLVGIDVSDVIGGV